MSRLIAASFVVYAFVFLFAQPAFAAVQDSSNAECPAPDRTHEYAGAGAPAARQQVVITICPSGTPAGSCPSSPPITIFNLSKKTCTQTCPAGSVQPTIKGLCTDQTGTPECKASETCAGKEPEKPPTTPQQPPVLPPQQLYDTVPAVNPDGKSPSIIVQPPAATVPTNGIPVDWPTTTVGSGGTLPQSTVPASLVTQGSGNATGDTILPYQSPFIQALNALQGSGGTAPPAAPPAGGGGGTTGGDQYQQTTFPPNPAGSGGGGGAGGTQQGAGTQQGGGGQIGNDISGALAFMSGFLSGLNGGSSPSAPPQAQLPPLVYSGTTTILALPAPSTKVFGSCQSGTCSVASNVPAPQLTKTPPIKFNQTPPANNAQQTPPPKVSGNGIQTIVPAQTQQPGATNNGSGTTVPPNNTQPQGTGGQAGNTATPNTKGAGTTPNPSGSQQGGTGTPAPAGSGGSQQQQPSETNPQGSGGTGGGQGAQGPAPAQQKPISLLENLGDALKDFFTVGGAQANEAPQDQSALDRLKRDVLIASQGLGCLKVANSGGESNNSCIDGGIKAAQRLANSLGDSVGKRVQDYVKDAQALGPLYEKYVQCKNASAFGALGCLGDGGAVDKLKKASAKVQQDGENLLPDVEAYVNKLKVQPPAAFKDLGTATLPVAPAPNKNPATEGPPPPTPPAAPAPASPPAPAQKSLADTLAPLCNVMGGCGNICSSSSPLTCRTNNPGALTCGVAGTCSTIAKNYGGFSCGQNNNTACFPTLEQGVAAQAALLAGPRYFGGGNPTIQTAICNSYATNAAGNDCASYAATVSKLTGIPQNQVINPNDKAQLGAIMMAMSRVESGKGVLYTPQQLQAGLEIAAGNSNLPPGTWTPGVQPCNYQGCAPPTPNPQVAAARVSGLTALPSGTLPPTGAKTLTDPTSGASFSCTGDTATCVAAFQQQAALSRLCASDPSTCNGTAGSYTEKASGNVVPLSPQQVQQKINDYLWSHMSNESMSTIIKSAAQAGLSPEQYAIGGMDPNFKENLYIAGQAMDKANVSWNIVNGYRSDYNQELICGSEGKSACAPPGWSYHGGSVVTGGYGHGMAADISGAGQQWLLQNGQQYGIGHPYSMSYDAPHFAPTGSSEYIKQQGQPSISYQSVLAQQQTQLASLFPQQTYNLIGPDGNPVLGPDGNPLTTTQAPGADGTTPFLVDSDGKPLLDKNGNPIPVNPVPVTPDPVNPDKYTAPDDRPPQPKPANPWGGRVAGDPYNTPGSLQPAQIAQVQQQQPQPYPQQPPQQPVAQPIPQPLPLPQLPINGATSTPSSGSAVVTIVANPASVASSSTSRIVWSSVGTVSCQVGPQNGTLIGTSTNGSARSAPLATSTLFVASCITPTNLNVTATTSVTVQ